MATLYCEDLDLRSVKHFDGAIYGFKLKPHKCIEVYVNLDTGKTFAYVSGAKEDLIFPVDFPPRELTILNGILRVMT